MWVLPKVLPKVLPRVLPKTRSMATYFTKDHEYANVTGAVATCGITDFAQSQLGDVVYVSLPEIGTVVKKG